MYRRTSKYTAKRLEAMRRGKERARMERPAPDYPADLPEGAVAILRIVAFDSPDSRSARRRVAPLASRISATKRAVCIGTFRAIRQSPGGCRI